MPVQMCRCREGTFVPPNNLLFLCMKIKLKKGSEALKP